MPNGSTAELQAYLKELIESRDQYLDEAIPALEKNFARGKGEIPPRRFNDASFLYIRSHPGDTGSRPLGNVVHWHSPDIQLVPGTGGNFTTQLEAGASYIVSIRLHNGGDMAVPYPKVELFLSDPTLGFDTRYSTHIATTQHDGILLPNSTALVQHHYQVPFGESGHKCLFARTWSFSPPDLPIDLHALDPRIDQRIAQQNLHVVQQGQPYMMQIVHPMNADDTIEFVTMHADDILRLHLPHIHAHRLRGDIRENALERIEFERQGKSGGDLEWDHGRIRLRSHGDGPSLEEQQHLEAALSRLLSEHGRDSQDPGKDHFRSLVAAYRKASQYNTRTRLAIKVPDLGLQEGEVAGVQISRRCSATGNVHGGITLLVTG